MNQIKKHSFEAVSLLTAANGMLEATVIPAINQPDWIVPSTLILDTIDYDDASITGTDINSENESAVENDNNVENEAFYLWQQQPVAVFSLLAKQQTPSNIIILEGNTADYRLALKIKGQLRQIEISISEVQDTELPPEYCALAEDIATDEDTVSEDSVNSYLYQAIVIEDTVYMVPDLDKIANQLVNINQ